MDDINYLEIGSRVRQEREKLKLSREKLASLIGVSPYYIGQIERGERKMSMDTIIKMAMCLHLSSDYMLMGIDQRQAEQYESSSADEERERLQREINELIFRCNQKELELVSDMLKLIIPQI